MDYVVATDTTETSERLAAYLTDRLTDADTVYAVNSQVGGDETTSEQIRSGEAALDAFESAVGDTATVERHQFVRGNDPAEDIRSFAAEVDADELVFTAGGRTPTGKALFGSVAQQLLLNAERPMRVVPREES